MVALTSLSCMVIENPYAGYVNDPKSYSKELLDDAVTRNLTCFYNAYHIARFLQAAPEQKVSQEFDLIRTGLRESDGAYSYSYVSYQFITEDFFAEKGVCTVKDGRWYTADIRWVEDGRWKMMVKDGTVLEILVTEDDAAGLSMVVTLSGEATENSSYTAVFAAEDLKAEFRHAQIGKIDMVLYDGRMSVLFCDAGQPLLTCTMFFASSETVFYDVTDHLAD